MKKHIFNAIFAIFSGIFFLSCAAETGTEKQEQEAETETTEEVQSGETTLTWSGASITIEAEKFSDFTEGCSIQIEYKLNSESYHNVKMYDGNWSNLSAGIITGAQNSKGTLTPSSSSGTIRYSATNSDVSALKSTGLIIHGFGVVVTKVSLVIKKSASSSSENSPPAPTATAGTPFANHGKLHVDGAYLMDSKNQKYQLYGMSTHGINFGDEFSRYVNQEAFQTLVDDWNTNCIRIVLYPHDYNGYCNGGDQIKLKQIVKNGIEYATNAGMYVLVDWHVHQYNPNDTKDEAKNFLAEIAKEYANYGNVLYEICNEPTGSPWDSDLKPYAEEVIPVIRQYANDAVIIVGTNTWSQDIEGPLSNPLAVSKYGNVMYTFHFYANTHTDSYRSRVESAIQKGLPIFITEFGTCDASGNGGFNATESQKWFDLCEKYKISHLNWSLSNKNETASAISSGCSKTSGWSESELTESGKLVRNHFKTLTR